MQLRWQVNIWTSKCPKHFAKCSGRWLQYKSLECACLERIDIHFWNLHWKLPRGVKWHLLECQLGDFLARCGSSCSVFFRWKIVGINTTFAAPKCSLSFHRNPTYKPYQPFTFYLYVHSNVAHQNKSPLAENPCPL